MADRVHRTFNVGEALTIRLGGEHVTLRFEKADHGETTISIGRREPRFTPATEDDPALLQFREAPS
jgi:hypothetical protein